MASRYVRLEQVPETELNVPARAVLTRDAAERGIQRVGARAVPVRVIQEVEDLRTELDRLRAADLDVLEERRVPLILTRIVDAVARGVPERPVSRTRERR